ncbi:dienelactone hydrolase family protein [Acidisoma cellulosilytica]|uniref:Dienelactone hydrolase family protein n=1 Tax=Acidisoma cellulosilyticum TaxID=2802395 RepID=A0A963Z4X2_9PROT|nr:dienelactone hydrolase family protein [Acidisoma cellulosilyticum]MCB8882699.1 dienelactone hydrolase family protein [Acidisoma cellulosilyticum]
MTHETITIETEDGAFSAYLAKPDHLPAPAVVVLHEIFGVNRDIRQTCDELAAAGFIAVAPDLFWRQEPGVDLNTLSDEEWQKGFALYTGYDRDIGVDDIVATLDAAAELDDGTGMVGVMGFCLGGLMTYLTAARHDVDAAVAYHGGDTERYLDEADAIGAPLLMHLAEEDEYINKDAQASIVDALSTVPDTTVYSYAGQNHAFARHNGAHYNAEAAALANGRTIAFLAEHLGLNDED